MTANGFHPDFYKTVEMAAELVVRDQQIDKLKDACVAGRDAIEVLLANPGVALLLGERTIIYKSILGQIGEALHEN